MVEPDLAELVDDHRRVGQRRLGDQMAQQGGLAAAEEAGEDRHRQAIAGHAASAFGALTASRAPSSRLSRMTAPARSEEQRVGKGCVSTGRSRGRPDHSTKKNKKQ